MYDIDEVAATGYPEKYRTFVKEIWLDQDYNFTRRSERTKDDVKNRKDPDDDLYHRIHWRDARYVDILLGDSDKEGMLALGKKKCDEALHLSLKTMMALEPFNVRKTGEETCVCVYHPKWEKLCQTYNKERKALKVNECGCQNLTCVGYEARSMTMCPNDDGKQFHKRECIYGACGECPGLEALRMCEAEQEAAEHATFKMER